MQKPCCKKAGFAGLVALLSLADTTTVVETVSQDPSKTLGSGSPFSMKRSSSLPSFPVRPETSSQGKLLEVYVVLRPFMEWGGQLFHSLPPSCKQALEDLGVAHYLVAVRTPEGRIFRFDFGPAGGRDIVLPSSSKRKRRACARRSPGGQSRILRFQAKPLYRRLFG